jgi:hemerythrin-like domain-containing protein
MSDLTANEDLAREHGLLNRILLIYDEIVHRLQNNIDFDYNILLASAYLIRVFVEDYHEKMEEKYIFPNVAKNPKYKELIDELIKQHNLSRIITNAIMIMAPNKTDKKYLLTESISVFTKMYRYHEAREDTEIFPAFKELTSKEEYEKIGKLMDETEDEIFGGEIYGKFLNGVAQMEEMLGIHDISNQTQIMKILIEKIE